MFFFLIHYFLFIKSTETALFRGFEPEILNPKYHVHPRLQGKGGRGKVGWPKGVKRKMERQIKMDVNGLKKGLKKDQKNWRN